ncbi:MAG: hypothetical protein VX642_10645 [Bdellovibrionota bacterium]|nr:hypothetical protein [Bdellovibrionota bacterium]
MGIILFFVAFFAVNLSAQIQDADVFQDRYLTKDFTYSKVFSSERNPKGMEFDHTGKLLFVANLYGRSKYKANVTVIDVENQRLLEDIITPNGTVPTKENYAANGTVEVTITEDNRFALVTRLQGCTKNCGGAGSSELTGSAIISVIDIETLKPVMYIPTGGQGSKIMGIKPGTNLVYVTNWFTNSVSLIDISAAYQVNIESKPVLYNKALKKVIRFPRKSAPRGIAFGKDPRVMYVLGFTSKKLYFVDTEKNEIVAETPHYVDSQVGEINFRHMVLSSDKSKAYISHMKGDAISRIDMSYVDSLAMDIVHGYKQGLDEDFWQKAFIPWRDKNGVYRNLLDLTDYSQEHPDMKGGSYSLADPNTIALDPTNNCYLYVSFRSGNMTGSKALAHGKVDVLDVCNDRRVISLTAGRGPTALAVSRDGTVLASSGFFDHTIHMYNSQKIKFLYESIYGTPAPTMNQMY